MAYFAVPLPLSFPKANQSSTTATIQLHLLTLHCKLPYVPLLPLRGVSSVICNPACRYLLPPAILLLLLLLLLCTHPVA
jgi:hypothetical protein